jgi:voltage-gated potassium channel
MSSVLLTLLRFFRGVRGAWAIPDFRSVLALVAMTIASGTVFFHNVEGWSWIDAFYFSVTTMSTVGYGDLAPKSDFGKLFTTLYIVVAVGLFVALVSFLADGMLSASRRRRKQDGTERLEDDTKD